VFRARISRRLATAPDPELAALYEELLAPGPEDASSRRTEPDVVLPMVIRLGGRELRLFSTITTFGTPMDITVDELAIESYYPADAESAAYFTEQRTILPPSRPRGDRPEGVLRRSALRRRRLRGGPEPVISELLALAR
jgi:hypothetical protein